MKTQNVKFTVNAEDVRKLGSNAVSHVIARFVQSFEQKLVSLNLSLEKDKAENILKGLEGVSEVFENVQEDLHNLVPLLEKVEPLLSPDTQIIKDLPDLLEDSSGVD